MSNESDNITFPLEIIMEDGTSLEDMPKNPLIDKWIKEGHTKDIFGNDCSDILGYYDDGRPIINYSCVLCGSNNCYLSNFWKIPEEDKEAYKKWKDKVREFYKQHSPEMYRKYMEG